MIYSFSHHNHYVKFQIAGCMCLQYRTAFSSIPALLQKERNGEKGDGN